MARTPSPLTLARKVQMAAERVAAVDATILHLTTVERPHALDALARLEAQVAGKASGWEDAPAPSGYITTNPYLPADHALAAPAPVVDEAPAKSVKKKSKDEE